MNLVLQFVGPKVPTFPVRPGNSIRDPEQRLILRGVMNDSCDVIQP